MSSVDEREFTVTFHREVTQTDRVTRTISAASEDEAWQKANSMADDFDGDCPDDCEKDITGSQCHSWVPTTIEAA